jgi:putative transposase
MIFKGMTTDLISKAILKEINLVQAKRSSYFIVFSAPNTSASALGPCWGNVVLEGFFGSLKHGWILEIAQPTREYIKQYDRA